MARFAFPGICLLFFAAIFAQALTVFIPIVSRLLFDPGPSGQALRQALKWISLHLAVPLAGAIAGGAVVVFRQRRSSR
ncbi:MAG: hypothetical protein A3G34_03030 [Candidatus Lindowbacteria bacterium RIFCSPLOWO2_12_FULL_62_27]|nr:MAG: hypothetical protein A3G34_03030 [Candidatus Lindowbacteria bacterium RIFCSPLOWO2_12_FULL_62_27]OGH62221.1 MAG: hypothetical protein A3I06_05335 [Candidatus Lindowbacteria bacterium RIFCSPLOWO2_02_FULL_62_12]